MDSTWAQQPYRGICTAIYRPLLPYVLANTLQRRPGWCGRYSDSPRARRSGDRIPVWDFQHPSTMAQGPALPSGKYVTSLSRGYKDRGVALTMYPHLAPRLYMGTAILLPPLCAIRTYYSVTFTFNTCKCPPLRLRDWRWGLRCSGTRRNFSNLSPNDAATRRTPPASPDTLYRGAEKSLARPGRKQATATEDFDVHISYL